MADRERGEACHSIGMTHAEEPANSRTPVVPDQADTLGDIKGS